MKKAYFDKPVNLYELKKTYTDDVEFISDTTSFPLVSGITYEGSLNKVIKGKLRAKDMKKKVDRLLEVYKRRLFRHWDDHVDQLLNKLSLPIHKGGPGSGCNPEVATCGRPKTGSSKGELQSGKGIDRAWLLPKNYETVRINDDQEHWHEAVRRFGGIGRMEPMEQAFKNGLVRKSGAFAYQYQAGNNDAIERIERDMEENSADYEHTPPIGGYVPSDFVYIDAVHQTYGQYGSISYQIPVDELIDNGFKVKPFINNKYMTKFIKGGPGSGCTGENCGRPSLLAEFHETESPVNTIIVEDVRPAIKYRGEVFVGAKGSSHSEVYDKNINKPGPWIGIEQGFVDNDTNRTFITRDALKEQTGIWLSEDLNEVQQTGKLPERNAEGWLVQKADEDNKDSDERKKAIAAIVTGLGASLAGTALDYYRQAYLLGKERGISISGQDFRAAVSEEAAKKIQNFSDGNKEYLNGFMENLNNKFNGTIDQEYATKEAEAEAIKRVAVTAEARLALYVTAILGAFAFGMTDGIKEGEEEKEEGEEEVTGIIWITNHDDAVCEGCASNDGTFFTLEEFEAEYQHNECLTRCRCAEVSEPTTAPSEHFARSVRIKDLVKGGPGSGCNPAVATCGRPAGTDTKDIKSLVAGHISRNWRTETIPNTFSSFRLPEGLNLTDLNETHKELQNNEATGTLTGKFKILYNSSKDEAVIINWSNEHANAHEALQNRQEIEGNMDSDWSRMEYSKDKDKKPVLHIDYWHDTDDFDDPKYKNYNNTIWSVVNNKSFPDDMIFETNEIRTHFNQTKTFGEWRKIYQINKGGPGSGCNPAVGTCGRPKENFNIIQSKVPELYRSSGKAEEIAWLLPNGASINATGDTHADILREIGIPRTKALKDGWVRKAGRLTYHFNSTNPDALELVDTDLQSTVYGMEDKQGYSIFLDDESSSNDADRHSYEIQISQYEENPHIKDFMNNKFLRKFVKGGVGSGCNPAVGTCGRPKSATPKQVSPYGPITPDVYVTSGKGVYKAWLLPEKYNTVPVRDEDVHGEFAEKHFGRLSEAFKHGLVRKTGPNGFQFQQGNTNAIERVERDIEENAKEYHGTGLEGEGEFDTHQDFIFIDTINDEYDHTAYSIGYEELINNDYKIKNLLNNKNMIKFEKGGPGSGCNPEVGQCGRPKGSGDATVTSVTGTTGESIPGVEIEGQTKPKIKEPKVFKWKDTDQLHFEEIVHMKDLDFKNPEHQEKIKNIRHSLEIKALGKFINSRRALYSKIGTSILEGSKKINIQRDFHEPEKLEVLGKMAQIEVVADASSLPTIISEDEPTARIASEEKFRKYVVDSISHFPKQLQERIAGSLTRVELTADMAKDDGGLYYPAGNVKRQKVIAINAHPPKDIGVNLDLILTHELAHSIDHSFKYGGPDNIVFSETKTWKEVMGNGRPITGYAKTNTREYFAESVTTYLYLPEKLKQANPKAYEVIDELFKNKTESFELHKSENKQADIPDGSEEVIHDDFKDSIVEHLSDALNEQSVTVEKGGPGSGCRGPNCGRPNEGGINTTETHTHVPTSIETGHQAETQTAPLTETRTPATTIESTPILQSKFDKFFDKTDMRPGSEKDAPLIREHIAEVMSAYNDATMKDYGTSIPVVSSGDLPKTMDLPFRDKFKAEDSASRHAAASAVSKIFDEQMLNDPSRAGKPVMVLGGTSGAGKTHVVRAIGITLEENALVKDTNLNNLNSAKRIIDGALNTGHPVQVNFVERDPIEAFIDGVYRRFKDPKRDGRLVPIEVHLRNSKARDAIKEIHDYYKNEPRVSVRAFENASGKPVKQINLDDIKPLSYTMDDARVKLTNFIKEKYDTGQLTQSEYNAFIAR
jgi:hypothetical protein